MREDSLTYRRTVSDLGSWRDFSVQHVAFALHRITGWLLLGWVALHLAVPASGTAVWNPLTALPGPLAEVVVVGLFAVLLFHGLNGLRLLAAELLGVGTSARTGRQAFLGTLLACALLVAGLGVTL